MVPQTFCLTAEALLFCEGMSEVVQDTSMQTDLWV